MTFKEVATMVASIGPDTAYYQFPDGTQQATPFICFYYEGDNDFKADNLNYQKVEHLVIELYTDNKDFEQEAAVEEVLASYGFAWSRSEQWIDSERMQMVVYETDVLITPEPPAPDTSQETENTEELNNGE